MPRKDALANRPDTSDFPIIAAKDSENVLLVLQENMGPDGMQLSDLDRVTVPPGGGTTFEIPTMEGDTEPTKALDGIIAYAPEQKAYWSQSLEENPGAAPDCFSNDSRTGVGAPGGDCSKCPMGQWDSGPNGRGKACTDVRPLFMLTPGNYVPIVLSVPRTSLKHIRKYFTRLSSKGIPYYGCVTRITLNKTKNKDGIEYSELVPAVMAILNEDQRARVKEYQGLLKQKAAETPDTVGNNSPVEGADHITFDDETKPAAKPKAAKKKTP